MYDRRHDTLTESAEHATGADGVVATVARGHGNRQGGEGAQTNRPAEESSRAPALRYHATRDVRQHVAPEERAQHQVHRCGIPLVVLSKKKNSAIGKRSLYNDGKRTRAMCGNSRDLHIAYAWIFPSRGAITRVG